MSTPSNQSPFDRTCFPMLKEKVRGKPLIYLDSAATTLKPKEVIEALNTFYSKEYGTVHRAVYSLAGASTDNYFRVREKIQKFLNARSSQEIIFTKGTTESVNLVASAFGRQFVFEGDEVIISEMEHHANIIPWQVMCAERKAHLKVIPINEKGELILEAYQNLLSEKTKIVCITHVSNVLGTINPIKLMTELAHEKGAKVFVDGAQSAPHMCVDVTDLDVDFFAFSGHKMFGPTGIGVLYGKYELLEKMPPYQCGGDMIDTVSFEKTTYQAPPLRFEAGTPSIGDVMGLGAAIDFIESVGRKVIENRENYLLEYATEELKRVPGVRIFGTAEKKGPILTFVVEGVHALDLGMLLDLKGICVRTGHLCAQPLMKKLGVDSVLRASFGVYNTIEEIDVFISSLKEAIAFF